MDRPQRKRRPMSADVEHVLKIAAVILAALLIIALIIALSIRVELSLNGGTEPIRLVYGKDVYQEQGATASAHGKALEVTISGEVDHTKLGTYHIYYSAQYLWATKTVEREVIVLDATAPVITLTYLPGHVTPPGQPYEEEGFRAVDDYDGDITDKVQTSVEGDVVTYTVADSSGNQTSVQRNILRSDVQAPVLTLNGPSSITISAGTPYQEAGFTAIDGVDGDITANVQISGSVNIYHAGVYTLTYTATDKAGNTATAERTVTVEPIKQPETVTPGGKVIYLTFDDGPGPYTQKLLNVLNQYNAKATFFLVNTGYNMNSLLNAMVAGGHGIGIHSVDHDYAEIYASEEAFFQDLYGMQEIIKKYTGVTTTLMRFPGGSSNTVSKKYCEGIMSKLVKAVTDQGFQYFDWNVDSKDAGGAKTADEVFQNVVNGVSIRNHAVVLQHDIQKFSVEAVERILIWGIQNGYSFQALTPNSPICHHDVNN